MKIAVTGATGFIGSATVSRLVGDGHFVISAARRPIASDIPVHVVGDVDSTTDWAAALKDVDCIVHLAARVHRMNERDVHALAAYRNINTQGTRRLAQAAAKAGVHRLVFLSTAKVLGEFSPATGFDDRSTPAPIDPYSISKWEAEQALHDVSRTTGLEVCILRPPLVYGPGVGANFGRLLRWVDRGYPLPLGAIDNRRSLIGLENLIDAVAVCTTHPNAANSTFLVSDNETVSTPQLVRLLADLLHKPARLIPTPTMVLRLLGRIAERSAEIDRLTGDFSIINSGIRATLEWQPPLTLRGGLEQTVTWYRNRDAAR